MFKIKQYFSKNTFRLKYFESTSRPCPTMLPRSTANLLSQGLLAYLLLIIVALAPQRHVSAQKIDNNTFLYHIGRKDAALVPAEDEAVSSLADVRDGVYSFILSNPRPLCGGSGGTSDVESMFGLWRGRRRGPINTMYYVSFPFLSFNYVYMQLVRLFVFVVCKSTVMYLCVNVYMCRIPGIQQQDMLASPVVEAHGRPRAPQRQQVLSLERVDGPRV